MPLSLVDRLARGDILVADLFFADLLRTGEVAAAERVGVDDELSGLGVAEHAGVAQGIESGGHGWLVLGEGVGGLGERKRRLLVVELVSARAHEAALRERSAAGSLASVATLRSEQDLAHRSRDARLGQQSGYWQYAFSNRTPRVASRSIFGDLTNGCP